MQKRGEVGWLVGEKGKTRAAGKSRKQRERGWFLLFITSKWGMPRSFLSFSLFCFAKKSHERIAHFFSAQLSKRCGGRSRING